MTDEQIKLVEDNIKLVNYFINKYYHWIKGNEDMYQLGCLGLVKAAQKWNPGRGAFSHFAGLMIRREINQAIQYSNRQMRKADEPVASLDFRFDEGTALSSVISTGEELEEDITLKVTLEKLLNSINLRYKQVIEMLYFEGLPNKEVARILGVSDQRIRQIESLALKKMKYFLDLN